jgi:hypothetical protein
MSVEPNAIFRADQIERAQLPEGTKVFFAFSTNTLTRLLRVELKPNGRVQLVYQQRGKRRQLTVEGDATLIVSFQDLDGHSAPSILRKARRAASPFSGVEAPTRFGVMDPHPNSVLAALSGSNFYG